jgi:hypothetical protein
MLYSQSPPLTAEETSSGGPARDPHARSDLRSGRQPLNAPIHSPHPSRLNDREVASDRPSIGRRVLRSLTRLSIAALIGIGATLGWQSYAKPPAVATTSPGPVQQLEPLAFNLDIMRRGAEQLAAKQEQMAQNIAALQAVEEDIRQKMSSTPPSPQAASIPQPKPPQPRAQPSAVPSSSVPRLPPPAGR